MEILMYARRSLGIVWRKQQQGYAVKGFCKKRDEWWDDEVEDAVERNKKVWQNYKELKCEENKNDIDEAW